MRNNPGIPQNNTTEWTVIQNNLKTAGFTPSYECILAANHICKSLDIDYDEAHRRFGVSS